MWQGRVLAAPFPPALGLEGMLRQNERDILLAARRNIEAVKGVPMQRSSASTRTWYGEHGAPLTTRSMDPNDALPVVDSRGRFFGHGAAGRRRMIAHAQEVMAGGSVKQIPFLSDVDGKDPFADDIRERPHTPIVDGNMQPVRFVFDARQHIAKDSTFQCTPLRPSTTSDSALNSASGPSPYLRKRLMLRRRKV